MSAPPLDSPNGPARTVAFSCPLAPYRGVVSMIAPWLVAMAVCAAISGIGGALETTPSPGFGPLQIASMLVLGLGLAVTVARSMVKPVPTHAIEIDSDHVSVVSLAGGTELLGGSIFELGVAPAQKRYSGRTTVTMPVVLIDLSDGKPVSIGAPDFWSSWSVDARSSSSPRFLVTVDEWPRLVAALGLGDVYRPGTR